MGVETLHLTHITADIALITQERTRILASAEAYRKDFWSTCSLMVTHKVANGCIN